LESLILRVPAGSGKSQSSSCSDLFSKAERLSTAAYNELVFLAFTLLAAGLLAFGADPAAVHLLNAQKALDAQNVPEAKAELDLAIKANPGSAEALLMLAGVEIRNGEAVRAIEHFQRALQLAPNSFVGHYDLALAYLHERKLADARRELERAVTLNPRQPDAVYNLGVVLLELGNASDALKYFHQARSLQPDRPDIVFNLIRAELAAGDWPAAREESRIAGRSFAADAAWQGSVGGLFLESGHPQDAVPFLEHALKLQPASADVRHLLASAYVQSRQPDLALSLIPSAKTAEEHFLRGSAFLVKRKLADADSEAGAALREKTDEPRYLLLAARIQQTEGRQDAALALLGRAAEHAPHWAEPYYCMAVSYYFEHRYEEARNALEQSLKQGPESPRSLFLFAVTFINQGNNHEAEEYLRRAIAIQPDNARYWLHLGAARLRNDNPIGAQEAFHRAIRLKPEYALPHYQLGKLLAHSDAQTAEQELEKAIAYEPSLVQAYYQLSRVSAALGQKEKSAQALATFNRLKKREEGEEGALSEDVNGELQHP
jgi:Flp pilus assembly protein TadD